MKRLMVVTAFAAVLGGCSCGGGNGKDGGTTQDAGPFIPLSDFCATAYQGFVVSQSPVVACGSPVTTADIPHLSNGLITYSQIFQAANCSDGGIFGALSAQLASSVDAGRMTYDGYKAGQCRAMGEAQGAVNLLNNPDSGAYDFCASVFEGTVATGGQCNFSEECAGDAYCLPSGPATCGGMCVARKSVGQTCDPNVDLCTRGALASCIDPQDGGMPSCLAPSPQGGPCKMQGCQAGLVCSAMTGLCVTSSLGSGQVCQNVGGNPSDCVTGFDCVAVADGGTWGTCLAPATVGDRCYTDETAGLGLPNCAATTGSCLTCLGADGGFPDQTLGGICQGIVQIGSTCTGDIQCPLGAFCQLPSSGVPPGLCARQPRPGETCTIPPGTALPDQNQEIGNCMYADSFCSRASANSATGTCTPQPSDAGDVCGITTDTWFFCAGSLSCIGPTSGTMGNCQNPPGAGQLCASSPGNPPGICNSASYCDGGACVPLPEANQACNANLPCASDVYCFDAGTALLPDGGPEWGVCLPLQAAGTACTDSTACGSGLCDTVTHTCIVPCQGNYTQCGCPDGARDASIYLLYAFVIVGARGTWARRQKKKSA